MKRLFIAGTGNVGRNLVGLINAYKPDARVVAIENRRGLIQSPRMTATDQEMFLLHPERYPKGEVEVDYDVYVDLRTASLDGRMEMETYRQQMESGKSIVTANKSGLANYWPEIMAASRTTEKPILYEATVAGGLPIFSMIRHSAGYFPVTSFRGIVNLTANFILKKMASGSSFESAAMEAMKLGIAETNMDDDLSGKDSARKAVILSNSLFGKNLRLSGIDFSGIRSDSISNGMLLVIIEGGDHFSLRSGVVELNDSDPFLSMKPTAMAAEIGFMGRAGISISEEFDGPLETASAVLSDIIEI